MGCSSSKMDDSDVVLRCLRRKRLMREAVTYREDFAIAQLNYVETLRKVGHALCHFSEGDTSDTQTPPKSSIMSSPHLSPSAVADRSPPLATFVHPPQSPSVASESLSPALKTANRPPVISPLSTTTPQESSPTFFGSEAGAPFSTINGSPPYGGRDVMASPLKNADYSPPYHSPARESDGFFMPFNSSSPSVPQYAPPFPSSPQSSSWDPFSLFHSAPFTYHVEEQTRMPEAQEVEEEMPDFAKVAQEEGLPDLEEEEEEYEKEQPEQNEEQYHEEESKTAHPEDKGPEPTGLSTEKAVEKVDENQGGDVGVIVPVEKQDDASSAIVKAKNLTEAVKLMDDQFAKVVDSVKELSGMLETHAIHRNVSILDFRDSSKVLNAIIWHRPRKTAARLNDLNETSHVADSGMISSHASTLERIYTWEKKLYEEVKAGEHLRIAFDKKCKQLNILESKGEDHLVEKTKIAIRGLDSQLVVALKAVYSASMSIQQLTNEELFPQLAEMLGGLINMWKVMLECHKTQKAIALGLQTLEIPKAGVEASEAHRNATIELEHEIEKWRNHIQLWVSSQEKYIYTLLAWLKLCHTEPEKDGSNGAMSLNRTMGEAPIYLLIKNWHGSLTHLDEHMKVINALKNFARVLHALQIGQSELLIQKKQVEAFAKDSDHRTGSLLTMRKRYREAVYSGRKANRIKNQSSSNDIHQERESFLNSSKNHQEEEHKQTLSCLQEYLPSIFEAMTSLAEIALREYKKLRSDTESLKF